MRVRRTVLILGALLAAGGLAPVEAQQIQPAPAGIEWTVYVRESASITCLGPLYGEQYLDQIVMDGNLRGTDNTLFQTWDRTRRSAAALAQPIRAQLHQQYLQNPRYRLGNCTVVGRAPTFRFEITDARPPLARVSRVFNDPVAAMAFVVSRMDLGVRMGLPLPAPVNVMRRPGGAVGGDVMVARGDLGAGNGSVEMGDVMASVTAESQVASSPDATIADYADPFGLVALIDPDGAFESQDVSPTVGILPSADQLNTFFDLWEQMRQL